MEYLNRRLTNMYLFRAQSYAPNYVFFFFTISSEYEGNQHNCRISKNVNRGLFYENIFRFEWTE